MKKGFIWDGTNTFFMHCSFLFPYPLPTPLSSYLILTFPTPLPPKTFSPFHYYLLYHPPSCFCPLPLNLSAMYSCPLHHSQLPLILPTDTPRDIITEFCYKVVTNPHCETIFCIIQGCPKWYRVELAVRPYRTWGSKLDPKFRELKRTGN